jgi:hypothetical protein
LRVGVRRLATGAVRAERRSQEGAGEATTIASIPLFMQVFPALDRSARPTGAAGGRGLRRRPDRHGRGAFEGLRVWGTGIGE